MCELPGPRRMGTNKYIDAFQNRGAEKPKAKTLPPSKPESKKPDKPAPKFTEKFDRSED